MKRLALSLLSLLLFGSSGVADTYSDILRGIEVSPGFIIGNTRVGTTFVGGATGQLPGAWAVSVNYTPPAPGMNVTNTIVGGRWELAVFRNRRFVGKLFGTVTTGTVSWNKDGTEAGVAASLTVNGGTGLFAGANGTGTFSSGTLSHLFFPPRIGGVLTLNF